MSHAGAFFGKTCPERQDHRCFDGAPCGRDQWVLVGAVDSCTQEQQGKRITVSSIQIHTEREVDINMHRYRQSTGRVCDVNIHTTPARQCTLMLALFYAVRLSRSPSVPTSSMPDKNASLCTQGPILCLKSHQHLCSPYAVLPFLRLSVCLTVLSVSPAALRLLQLQRGPQTPSLSSSSSPSRVRTRPDHTCHLHRTQGPGT